MKKVLPLFLSILLSVPVLKAQVQTPMTLPAHSSVFTGNVRGYYFVAPTCFTITGVQLPPEAGGGSQNIAIMRLQSIPPLYAITTNAFDTLFVTQNNPNTGILPVNILVNQGDIIGILGQAGNQNSYAAAGFVSSINGFPVTLNRLGMQFPLSTTLPEQIWTENGGSISRVTMFYDTTMLYNISYSNIGADYTFADGTDTTYTSLFSVWDYGDGSSLDTNYNPTHTYLDNGNYNACSYVNTACGIDTVCTSVNVCYYAPIPGFSTGSSGLNLTINDASVHTTGWSWDFGDGNTSTLQNPNHTYAANGWYDITQIVSNPCGPNDTIIDSVLICVPPTANYSNSTSGLDASFTDASTFTTSWSWDFGDGNTSTLQNPAHTYASMGWYTVTLISSNFCGPNDTIIDSVLICPLVTATFGFSGETTGNVQFTDGSTGTDAWIWDFGDGNTDNVQNPLHTYASNGWYTVTQIISNSCGNTDTIVDSVLVCVPMVANFSFSGENSGNVQFTDGSVAPDTWMWDFGDGNTSTSQNPLHLYGANGTYNVCLISSDLCSADTTCISVTTCPQDPTAGFTSSNTVFTGNFTNTSTISISYLWDFGDGNTSTSLSPNHTYTTIGNYNVCLTSYDECGDSSVFCDSITIAGNIGIEENNPEYVMNIFPNPSHGQTTLNIYSPENIKGRIYITDITGKIVQSLYAGEFMIGKLTSQVNTFSWTNGIYLLVWETDKWKISKKLLID